MAPWGVLSQTLVEASPPSCAPGPPRVVLLQPWNSHVHLRIQQVFSQSAQGPAQAPMAPGPSQEWDLHTCLLSQGLSWQLFLSLL